MLASDLHFKTKVPMFDEVTLHLVITTDLKKAHESLGLKFRKTCASHGGEVHQRKKFDIYIFITEDCLNHVVLAHELEHAKNTLCHICGMSLDRCNDEADARIIGHLHKWAYSKLAQIIK